MKKIPKRLQIENRQAILKFALNHVKDAILLIGKDAHIYYVNDEACNSLGYSREELLNLSIADINPDRNWDTGRWDKHWDEFKAKGSPKYESHYIKKSGTIFPVEVTSSFFEFEGHEYKLALVRNITERNLARNLSDLHSEILLHVQEGVQITRVEDETIVYATPVFNRMFGYQDDELIGKKVSILNAPTSQTPEKTAFDINQVLRISGNWRGEIQNIRKDGSTFWCWVSITTFDHHEFGKVWVAVHEDITQRKESELHLQQARDISHRELLVREVHHRIKNNLQGIMGVLRQYAQGHPGTSEPINQAISQVQSIAVIHGLQGRSSLAMVRLCELTNAIASGVESLWQKPVSVDIPAAWTPRTIKEAEAVPLALVLNELISNAVKHGENSGPIKITLRHAPPDAIRVTIMNEGQLPPDFEQNNAESTGLKLVSSLLPRYGARLTWKQQENTVITLLELDSPIIMIESPMEAAHAH